MLEGHSLSVTWETPDGCLHTRTSGAEMTKNVENWNTKKGELKTEKVVFLVKIAKYLASVTEGIIWQTYL